VKNATPKASLALRLVIQISPAAFSGQQNPAGRNKKLLTNNRK